MRNLKAAQMSLISHHHAGKPMARPGQVKPQRHVLLQLDTPLNHQQRNVHQEEWKLASHSAQDLQLMLLMLVNKNAARGVMISNGLQLRILPSEIKYF